jgi:hypothetical protein
VAEDEYEKLLREVERITGGTPAKPAPAESSEPETRSKGRVDVAFGRALTAATASAVFVFVLFILLPFLGSVQGAAGAFVGTFAAVFVLSLRRR